MSINDFVILWYIQVAPNWLCSAFQSFFLSLFVGLVRNVRFFIRVYVFLVICFICVVTILCRVEVLFGLQCKNVSQMYMRFYFCGVNVWRLIVLTSSLLLLVNIVSVVSAVLGGKCLA